MNNKTYIMRIAFNVFIIFSALYVLYNTKNHFIALFCALIVLGYFCWRLYDINRFYNKNMRFKVQILNTLFDASTDIVIYLDMNLKIISANKALLSAFSIPYKDIVGKHFYQMFRDRISDDNRLKSVWKQFKLKIDETIDKDIPVEFTNTYYSENNEARVYNVLITPVHGINNIKSLIISCRDITKEYELRASAQYNQELLQTILSCMPSCSYVIDKNKNFIIGNTKFLEAMNCNDVSELVMKDIYDENYLRIFDSEEAEVFKTKKQRVVERQVVLPKTKFWGKVLKAPILDENGEVKAIVGIFENLEPVKELERQKEYFIDTLIHDMKIPTIAQLRALEIMASGAFGEVTKEQRELISEISDSCKCILNMISVVLNTYRFENGQNKLSYSVFNVSELINEIFNETSSFVIEKNLTYINSSNNNNITIEADRDELKKVIVNLLFNATSYSDKNEKIIINTELIDNNLKFSIKSKGIVLSERECITAFDRASSSYPKYSTIGYGIGLYLSKKIVELHNGQIFASSSDDFSIFTFLIPIKKCEVILSGNV